MSKCPTCGRRKETRWEPFLTTLGFWGLALLLSNMTATDPTWEIPRLVVMYGTVFFATILTLLAIPLLFLMALNAVLRAIA